MAKDDLTLSPTRRYSKESNLFFSTDFHRIVFSLPVGNTTSISRTTLEYFMTQVQNMFKSVSFFFLQNINEVQAEAELAYFQMFLRVLSETT
jgi:hypothetical protein